MKKLIILFILILSSTTAFAADPTAKRYIKDGETIRDMIIDATGYTHGIEMNTPGTAWIRNVQIKNAGTPGYLTEDGRHGDGIGVVVSGAGAHLIVFKSKAISNSEDGFRAINGGKLTIMDGVANRNGKNGFFVGTGSTLTLTDGIGSRNMYGIMGGPGFLSVNISDSEFMGNKNQGIHFVQGDIVDIKNTRIHDNNTDKVVDMDYGGMAIFGVKEVDIYDSSIVDNYKAGIFSDSDGAYNDAPTRVFMKKVIIEGNGDIAVTSRGNSVVTIIDSASTVTGKCLEEADLLDPSSVGIITVDGDAVTSDVCP